MSSAGLFLRKVELGFIPAGTIERWRWSRRVRSLAELEQALVDQYRLFVSITRRIRRTCIEQDAGSYPLMLHCTRGRTARVSRQGPSFCWLCGRRAETVLEDKI